MKTKQITFTEPYKAELLEVEYKAPSPREVTVELEYSAISTGTEKANFTGMRNSPVISEDAKPEFPRTVGYSATGTVIEIGSEVKTIKPGDRVVVFWGKHVKRITIGVDHVIKIPQEVTSTEAAFAFIGTFPLAAIRKTKIEIGESAMVMGLGILGILAVQELRAAGAYPVIAVDPLPERRELALKMGADFALDPMDEDFIKTALSLSSGGVNVCIEVTGLGIGLIQALECMKKMGRVALLGCTRSSNFEIDYYGKVHGRGISLIGAHTIARPRYESSPGLWTDRDDIQAILSLLKGNRLSFKEFISEIHSPEEANEVYNAIAKGENTAVGVLFDWSKV